MINKRIMQRVPHGIYFEIETDHGVYELFVKSKAYCSSAPRFWIKGNAYYTEKEAIASLGS